MEIILYILLPYLLVLARVSAFMAVAPIFGTNYVPMVVRAGIAMTVTVFLAMVVPLKHAALGTGMAGAGLLMAQEVVVGLALGLAATLLFMAVRQGAAIMGQQIGYEDAGIVDPTTSEEFGSFEMFFEVTFMVFFLMAGGHHMLISIIARSYGAFPMGAPPNMGVLAQGVIEAGSAMLLFALKLAAPLLAAFFILSVVLAVLARVLPEMNILVLSFPLRAGLGLIMASAILPTLSNMTAELGSWMNRFLDTA
jgi:flagellar biosynthetic protein FliR